MTAARSDISGETSAGTGRYPGTRATGARSDISGETWMGMYPGLLAGTRATETCSDISEETSRGTSRYVGTPTGM